jgi:hypothetical protein
MPQLGSQGDGSPSPLSHTKCLTPQFNIELNDATIVAMGMNSELFQYSCELTRTKCGALHDLGGIVAAEIEIGHALFFFFLLRTVY